MYMDIDLKLTPQLSEHLWDIPLSLLRKANIKLWIFLYHLQLMNTKCNHLYLVKDYLMFLFSQVMKQV